MKNFKKEKILLFGGTSEGRVIAEYFQKAGYNYILSVASEYGKIILSEEVAGNVINGRLNQQEIEALILKENITVIVDATHPYAVEVSNNIKQATNQQKIEYIRVIRETTGRVENAVYLKDMLELVNYLNEHEGRVLVTTGSKELGTFTQVTDYANRIYPRILPIDSIIDDCVARGFLRENIITGKGPYSIEENMKLIKKINPTYLVTKDTGINGGFEEKVAAARNTGVGLLIIERPMDEKGYSLKEFLDILEKNNG